MQFHRIGVVWLGCLACVFWASPGRAGTPTSPPPPQASARDPARVPLDDLPPAMRARACQVLERPTLSAQGPAETFSCDVEVYRWLLDNQHRASAAWRRLGARCVLIEDRGGGRFGWSDEQGSDVSWQPAHRGPALCVWYAEGVVRTGMLLGSVPVRALVVLRHEERRDDAGRSRMRHQLSLYLYADSKTVNLAKRLLGPSMPRLAEQYAQQMQLFFSALASYLERRPNQIETLMAESVRP